VGAGPVYGDTVAEMMVTLEGGVIDILDLPGGTVFRADRCCRCRRVQAGCAAVRCKPGLVRILVDEHVEQRELVPAVEDIVDLILQAEALGLGIELPDVGIGWIQAIRSFINLWLCIRNEAIRNGAFEEALVAAGEDDPEPSAGESITDRNTIGAVYRMRSVVIVQVAGGEVSRLSLIIVSADLGGRSFVDPGFDKSREGAIGEDGAITCGGIGRQQEMVG